MCKILYTLSTAALQAWITKYSKTLLLKIRTIYFAQFGMSQFWLGFSGQFCWSPCNLLTHLQSVANQLVDPTSGVQFICWLWWWGSINHMSFILPHGSLGLFTSLFRVLRAATVQAPWFKRFSSLCLNHIFYLPIYQYKPYGIAQSIKEGTIRDMNIEKGQICDRLTFLQSIIDT